MARRMLLIALAAAVVYLVVNRGGDAQVAQPTNTAPAETAAVTPAVFDVGAERERLHDRVQRYIELRKLDDWNSLYDMVNPVHRQQLTRAAFLQTYGHGMLKTHSAEVTDTGIEPDMRMAVTKLTLDTEIVPANMPAQFRTGFRQANDPEALQRQQQVDLYWSWSDGTWYFELDSEILSGRTVDGARIEFLDDERQGG